MNKQDVTNNTKLITLPEPLQRFEFTKDGVLRLSLVIRATLHENNWSGRDLAKNAQVSHATVNSYVAARVKHPNEEIIKAIANYIYCVDKIDTDTNSVSIYPNKIYKDWTELARIGTDEYFQNLESSKLEMETLRNLILNEIQKRNLTKKDYAKLVMLSLSVLEQILNGNIPGNKTNKLGKLAPYLTNPNTNSPFVDYVELASYCNLIESPAPNNEQEKPTLNGKVL